jgi:hypothetical protein
MLLCSRTVKPATTTPLFRAHQLLLGHHLHAGALQRHLQRSLHDLVTEGPGLQRSGQPEQLYPRQEEGHGRVCRRRHVLVQGSFHPCLLVLRGKAQPAGLQGDFRE